MKALRQVVRQMHQIHETCQAVNNETATRPPGPRLFWRIVYLLKRYGLVGTLKRARDKAYAHLMRRRKGRMTGRAGVRDSRTVSGSLNLQPGERVRVKSMEEIAATLNGKGALKGLLFVPEMRPFCGRICTVRKRVERIFLEESGEKRSMRDTVLLEGVYCDGVRMQCDRSCFLYWREAWLERVSVDDAPPSPCPRPDDPDHAPSPHRGGDR